MESAIQESEADKQPFKQLEHTPVPDWVRMNEVPIDVLRRGSEPITRLLMDVQHDTESKSSCIRLQQRLENNQAVQELSQWRINFDPNSQQIQLHHIRVIREGLARDYSQPENVRFIQREEDLESYILHGQVTLLVVLEDIRAGDIIDSCYTLINKPQLLPDHFSTFQSPPNSIRTGHYHLSVRFPKTAKIHWKTENPENAPQVSEDGSHTCWTWEEKEIEPNEPETNMPSWELPKNWVQVSDMQTWSELSRAAHEAWPVVTDFKLPSALESKLDSKNKKDIAETLIRYVQDEFRYLSVKTNLGGQIPNPPEKVIQRCYGDCKDLSSLLTHLLRSQAIEARPILVNHSIGKNLPNLLPCGTLFDHVIVEFLIDGTPYWVDPTLSEQGGHATGRYVPPFHFGLAIQAKESELIEQPTTRTVEDSYHLHDTIMLDTASNLSILRVRTTATGKYADDLRLQLSHGGSEGFAKWTEERQNERYKTDHAMEPVKFHDERADNVWRMVELYKIDFYKSMSSNKQFLQLALPQTIVMTAVPVPEDNEDTERTCAFAIPDNLDLTHIVEVHSRTNLRKRTQRNSFERSGFKAKIEMLFNTNVWTQISRLQTSIDHVPAEKVANFRELLTDLWEHSAWLINAPIGQARLHRPSNFGELKAANPEIEEAATEKAPTPSKPIKTPKAKPQRLASHPDEIKKREQLERMERRRLRKEQEQALNKEGQSNQQKGLLKSITFWKK